MMRVDAPAAAKRPLGRSLPAEGADGLFSQAWYPVCLSADVPDRGVHGAEFLDGRVVVFRGEDGQVRVLSAYCLHIGTDLSLGRIVDGSLECPFHNWRYNSSGTCVATGTEDPAPRNARLFSFPAKEKYGIVFAFNGNEPLFELPEFHLPEDQLTFRAGAMDRTFPIDPWVISANSPDLQHITQLHRFTMLNDPYEEVRWNEYSVTFPLHAKIPSGHELEVEGTIYGTNYFFQTGTIDGRWFGFASPFGIPAPGRTKVFYSLSAQRLDGEGEDEVRAFIENTLNLEMSIASEDAEILATMHYRPGALTRSDRVLARFFEYLRRYPRCHPSAEYIR